MKILTFSYDDGVTQDIRLIELFNRYGMKATFNLNSALLGTPGELIREGKHVWHNKVAASEVRHVYEGHEVASHTLTHPLLPAIEDEEEIVRQVEEDRLALSELAGYEVVGFAYPGGGINYDARVSEILRRRTGVRYCRTTVSSHAFAPQKNLYEFQPSVYHHAEWDTLFSLGERFLALPDEGTQVFYVWGHAYEFDIHDTWDRFEDFLRLMSARPDLCYLTNREALLL
ncbi:MAG: polysaccharide deacetylase [Ruminococcaceae bacterium]|nr:polysaccharide deacetylase [Oscillospiraceae bacterium]